MKNLIVLIFLSITMEHTFSMKNCPKNCLCVAEGQNISIDCPIQNSSIEITISQNQEAKFTCFNNRMLDFNVNLKNVTSLYLKNCELPSNITKLFQMWNIATVEVLFFEDSKIMDGVVNKHFFDAFLKHNLKMLYVKNCGVKFVDEEAFHGFDNLEMLDFEQNSLSAIPDFFKYLPKLEVIDLQRNVIGRLPDVIRAPKLRGLHLTSNKLQNTTSNIFLQSPNILILDMSANKLKNIPENLLHPLKELTTVLLGLNGAFNLTGDFFKENARLEHLRFCGGTIIDIAKDAFDNLPRVSNITFYDTQLTDLRLGIFSKTVNLDTLTLAENRISYLSEGIFESLTNLTKLDLSGNYLTKWSKKFYKHGLKKLKILDLSGNNLNEIKDGEFFDLSNLETLILRRNNIKKISAYAFGISLTYLDLSTNQLKGENQELFNYLPHLKHLNLDENFYDSIPEVTSTNCTLTMKNNYLTILYMVDIINYRHVALSSNQIKSISFQYLPLTETTKYFLKLQIDNNPLSCDCYLLDLVRYFQGSNAKILKRVEIDIGDTNCFEPAYLKPKLVKNVTLADLTCKLDECTNNCSCLVFPVNNTLEIDCSGLNLTEAPKSIGFTPFYFMPGFHISKCVVNLKNNHISQFGKSENYENITELYLGNNSVSVVSWLPREIEVLELSNNSLTHLNESVLSFLESSRTLRKLGLDHNPWKCDCSLAGFVRAVKGNLSRKLENKHELLCSNGNNLNNISEEGICKKSSITPVILYSALICFLLSLAVMMVLYHIYEQPLMIWLRNHNIFLFPTQENVDENKEYDAFVSYSIKDEEFIEKHLVLKLEKEDPFKLCIPNRDWNAGDVINRKIIESIETSRRTIILLSKNFLSGDDFRMMEFRTAYQQGMRDRRNRIILVIYDDVDLNEIEDDDLNSYIRSTTYVKSGDPWFWEKIREAMPRKKW